MNDTKKDRYPRRRKQKAVAQVPHNSPADLILEAVKGKISIEHMDKLLEIQLKWQADQARKKYNQHMVNVQKAIPLIAKTLENPQTHSKYASLEEVICKTKSIYTEEGFSISFHEGETEKADHIRVCADVLHSGGHKETYHYDIPLDGVGLKGNPNMTKIHGRASSVSYGRRYLMCMIWNIPTGDDIDGNIINGYIDDKQKGQIVDMIADAGIENDQQPFLEYMGVESVDMILAKDFQKAVSALKAKKKDLAKKGEK